MLVLTRKVNETIFIGEDIRIVLVELQDGQARIGVSCPDCLPVMRAELGTRTRRMKWPNCSPDEIACLQGRMHALRQRHKIGIDKATIEEHLDLIEFMEQLQAWALREYVERYSHWYKED